MTGDVRNCAESALNPDDALEQGRLHYMDVAARIEASIRQICPAYSFSFGVESDFGLGVDLVNGCDIFGLGKAPIKPTLQEEVQVSSLSEPLLLNSARLEDAAGQEKLSNDEAVESKTEIEEVPVDLDTSVDEVVHELSRRSMDAMNGVVHVRTQLEAWLGVGASAISQEQQPQVDQSESRNMSGEVLQGSIVLDTSAPCAITSITATNTSDLDETRELDVEEDHGRPPSEAEKEENQQRIRSGMLEQLRAEELWLESAIWKRLHALRNE